MIICGFSFVIGTFCNPICVCMDNSNFPPKALCALPSFFSAWGFAPVALSLPCARPLGRCRAFLLPRLAHIPSSLKVAHPMPGSFEKQKKNFVFVLSLPTQGRASGTGRKEALGAIAESARSAQKGFNHSVRISQTSAYRFTNYRVQVANLNPPVAFSENTNRLLILFAE